MFRTLIASLLILIPAAGAADPKPIEPFNGKDLSGWRLKDQKKSKWEATEVRVNPDKAGELQPVKHAEGAPYWLVNVKGGGCDIYTEQKFGDCVIEVEFMIPKGSNSGVYVMGEYEVQVFDSYGKANDKLNQGDLGALYSAAAPKINASRKPGEWQKFVIEFQAPKFEGPQKIANAKFIKVTLNDQVIHENVEMKGPTPGGLTGKEAATGPLMFQGDHGPVAFRNIKVTPKQ
jgi:hypothetical protein